MNNRNHKLIDFFIIFFIISISVVIFLNRNMLEQFSTASYFGLFLICFLANATVLLPSPSLIIAASFALVLNPLAVALMAAFGSTLGEFVGYFLGNSAKEISPKMKGIFDKLKSKIKSSAFFVFLLALLPLPLFDVAGIYSGGTKMGYISFFVSCYIGKFIKLLFYIYIYKYFDSIIALLYA